MAAAFARPVGEGKRTPIGFRSRSWNFRILRGAPLAQKQKGNASFCRQPRHANRGGDAKQQVSWRPGTFREPVGSSRRVATEESNGRKHTFSIPVFHCKPLWPQATPTNAPEKKTRLSTSRYGFRCLALNYAPAAVRVLPPLKGSRTLTAEGAQSVKQIGTETRTLKSKDATRLGRIQVCFALPLPVFQLGLVHGTKLFDPV